MRRIVAGREWSVKNGSKAKSQELVPLTAHSHLLYHFCRMHLPAIAMAPARVAFHLQRTFDLYASKENESVDLQEYLLRLYQLDWFIACGCLEGGRAAWDHLFAAHAGGADCLLIDALRAAQSGSIPATRSARIVLWTSSGAI